MSQFQIFSAEEIEVVRRGGKILRECLQVVAKEVKPGITTKELDAIAETFIRSHSGATPAFKGYHGFPATLCISVNEEAVHGIPSDRILNDGDIVSLDGGVLLGGFYTDACVTVKVGTVPKEVEDFLDATKRTLEKACAFIKAGVKVGDISSLIQHQVEGSGYKCVRSLTGHGLGHSLHQFPDIPNTGKAGTGPVLPIHTVIAIEPITSMGTDHIREADDGWTISTSDSALSAHFEHTLLVTEAGCEILA